MLDLLEPVKPKSLKAQCIAKLETLILSGKLSAGQKLAPERELAQQLGVSRPVVHEALLDLAAKGLVRMVPRVGTMVNDFRREGSLAMLNSLLQYRQGHLSAKMLSDMLAMRALFEAETVRLAAQHRQAEHLQEMEAVIEEELACDPEEGHRLASLDFRFHHIIALASANLGYALLLNSFKPLYKNLLKQFFTQPDVLAAVIGYQREVLAAIRAQHPARAAQAMKLLLAHGEQRLRRAMAE